MKMTYNCCDLLPICLNCRTPLERSLNAFASHQTFHVCSPIDPGPLTNSPLTFALAHSSILVWGLPIVWSALYDLYNNGRYLIRKLPPSQLAVHRLHNPQMIAVSYICKTNYKKKKNKEIQISCCCCNCC